MKAVFLKSMLLIMFSQCCVNVSYAQEKIDLSVGIGFPEAITVGLRFQNDQKQLGFSMGSFPFKNEKLFTVSTDFYYHFGGFSELSERRPWFSRTGLIFFRDEKATYVDKLLYLNQRIGRDFNLSKKIGFELDAGIDIRILRVTTSGWNFPVLPGFGMVLFYRL